MNFKEFLDWCNQRACDGCWGMNTAIFCTDIIAQVKKVPFWKRERKWQELNTEFSIETNIVNVINQKIAEIYGKDNS